MSFVATPICGMPEYGRLVDGAPYYPRVGIVRNSATRIQGPFEAVHPAIAAAFGAIDATVTDPGNPIVADVKRSIRKNRWASKITAGVRPESPETTVVEWSVDMAGDKHHEVLAEVLDNVKFPIDDLGVGDALERLGKMGRFFGRLEAAALSQYVHLDERVVELAQGIYDKRQGMLVLTTQRLFFFDKGFLGAQVEEFDFKAIGSLGFGKKMSGETIDISISGRSAQISQVAHGRGETFIAAFRRVRDAATAAAAPGPTVIQQAAPAPDLADQIRKLSDLHAAGILTDEEFVAKKADLLARM